jgi:transcriptional regulator with XRE-family HTH domain
LSYIKNRIAKDRAEDPVFRAAYDEEVELIAKETALRQELMAVVADLRKAQRLSQQQLAARLKVSQARVSQMERGTESLSIDSVLQMVDALHGGIVILSPEEIDKYGLEHRLVNRGAAIANRAEDRTKKNPPGKVSTRTASSASEVAEKAPVKGRSPRPKRASAA